jgi:hypothetical protein
MPPRPPHAISPYEPAASRRGSAVLVTPYQRQSRHEHPPRGPPEQPPDPEDWPEGAYLDPEQASRFLKAVFNLNRGPRRLAELRVEGTGPLYFRDGNVVRYQPRHLREYAERCFGAPARSTAEEAVRRDSR